MGWVPNDKFTRQHRFSVMALMLTIFLVTSFFAIFGMEISYAIIFGIISGLIVSIIAFQRYNENES
jgi:hypothetical protein